MKYELFSFYIIEVLEKKKPFPICIEIIPYIL